MKIPYFFPLPSYFFLILVATVRPAHNRAVCQRSTPCYGFQTVEFRSDLSSNVCIPSQNATNYNKTAALESSVTA